MAEPRARGRNKGQQFDNKDLEAYLIAFGDDFRPLKETVRVLDEIITDYIIEMCHEAALVAAYSHRAKIKVDDFKFALRKDPKKLGRVFELLRQEKEIKAARKMFKQDPEKDAKRLKRDHDDDDKSTNVGTDGPRQGKRQKRVHDDKKSKS